MSYGLLIRSQHKSVESKDFTGILERSRLEMERFPVGAPEITNRRKICDYSFL